MKSLSIELFNPARPEHGQDVTLSITHNGYTPDKGGEVDIYIWHCEYGAKMTITDNEGGEACYMITSDTAIDDDTFQDLIVSLKSRIVELFGGWAQ